MKSFLINGCIGLVFLGLLFIGLLDWFSGCGESWVQADGTRIMGECMGREIIFGLFK